MASYGKSFNGTRTRDAPATILSAPLRNLRCVEFCFFLLLLLLLALLETVADTLFKSVVAVSRAMRSCLNSDGNRSLLVRASEKRSSVVSGACVVCGHTRGA